MNKLLINTICFFIPKKKNRQHFRDKHTKISHENVCIKGTDNKIIVIDEKGNEYVNFFSKIPSGVSIFITGNNNIIKLHLPIKTHNTEIRISNREKNSANYNNNYIEIFNISVWGHFIISFQNSNNRVIIGKNTCINDGLCIMSKDGGICNIGKNCLISDTKIWLTDYHTIFDIDTKEVVNKQKNECIISDNCWLGANTTILKNARIGNNCVVGINSTITKSFTENNCIIAGNPAKIIKTNIDWTHKCISDYEKYLGA